ncbi:hypothetical protein L6452_01319 [Arctium lappa]|uniref:Uncharacterized protein n=1 Tax=Arctium lappa TaxID=4217 RepID=A0ACB9FGG1_ARCLA|nr:hypothetical protein L6452_01319 [Arctium lappa]
MCESIRQAWYAGMGLGFSQSLMACTWALDFWYAGMGLGFSQSLMACTWALDFWVIADAGTMTNDLAKGSDAVRSVFAALDRYTLIEPEDPDDMSDVTNGYLDTRFDWIRGMKKDIKLRDFPSFIRTTDIKDTMLNYLMTESEALPKASGVVINTFDALEQDNIKPLITMNPRTFSIDMSCITWLDNKDPGSVVYVNFGSITIMTKEQLIEFAWGLANSKKDFLWITRPDIVGGDEAMMPPEFVNETKGRGMVTSWCPQEQVMKHPAIGGFLTHCGWNSTIESISSGIPVICWPFFAEQQTNCRYCCVEWGIGMEIDTDVKREDVEAQVREIMDGKKGKLLKNKALEWKKKAEEAVAIGGSSYINFDKLITDVLLRK